MNDAANERVSAAAELMTDAPVGAEVQAHDPFLPHDRGKDEDERDRGHQMPDADVERAVHAVSPIEDDERREREFAEIEGKIGDDAILHARWSVSAPRL